MESYEFKEVIEVDQKALLDIAYETIELEAESVSEAMTCVNEESFVKAVNAIASAPRVITTACGMSGMAAMKFAHSLCCLEHSAKYISPSEAIHGGLGYVQQKDTVVFISKGGNTVELNPILDISKRRGAITVAITENMNSYLAKNSDIVLQFITKQEAGENGILSTSSFLVEVALLDAITCAIMGVTGFDTVAFSEIHPGGAVGKKLASKKD